MTWRIDPTKTGLIILDPQERLWAAMADGPRVEAKIAALIQIARLLGIPCFLTLQAPAKLGGPIPGLAPLLKGVPNFQKTAFSAAGVLPAELPKSLIVAGIETHVCVRQTIYDLKARDRAVYLPGDATTSRSPLDHHYALSELQEDKVVVTSVEALAWEMVGGADSPHFAEALAILK